MKQLLAIFNVQNNHKYLRVEYVHALISIPSKGRFISIQLMPKLRTSDFLSPCNQKFTWILIWVKFQLQEGRKSRVQSLWHKLNPDKATLCTMVTHIRMWICKICVVGTL